MKIKMLLILVIFAGLGKLCSEINLGMGIDLPGNYEVVTTNHGIGSESSAVLHTGTEVFAEFMKSVLAVGNGTLSFGIGAGYLFLRAQDNKGDLSEESEFGFIPYYLIGKYGIYEKTNMSFYGKLKVGYANLYGNEEFTGDADLAGGNYTGISCGTILANLVLFEVAFQQYHGESSYRYLDEYIYIDTSSNITISHLSILLGIQIK